MGKSSIDGSFSMAMLNNQRVYKIMMKFMTSWILIARILGTWPWPSMAHVASALKLRGDISQGVTR